ncbi:MAG: PAS domain-containing protein [Deltaproteobacteria bacterium]|nr:PAS domain-containing protein [Deltaproteobacteria bacterium]
MTQYSVRRTLPAPSEPANFESLVAERDRLRAENVLLRERAEAREAAARESVALAAEVSRLRQALAALRAEDREEERLTPSRREPVLPRPSRLPREWDDAAPLFPEGAPSGHAFDLPPDPAKGLDFGTVSKLSPSELDALPYGLICLDARGRVVHYNDTESRLARLPKERVIGRNFFEDVAPCTRVREFEGQFFDLVRDPSRVRVRTFDFVFRFKHSEQHVTIVLTPARQRGLYNMALLRRTITTKDR